MLEIFIAILAVTFYVAAALAKRSDRKQRRDQINERLKALF
jgi:hypothetical protein